MHLYAKTTYLSLPSAPRAPHKLNAGMFGDYESYTGQVEDDNDLDPDGLGSNGGGGDGGARDRRRRR